MKTILFDIGNVLLAFDFQPALNSLTGPNAEPQAFEKIMLQKDIFEAGKQAKEDYITWSSQLLDFHGNHEEFETAWTSIFTPIQPMWTLAKELKKAGHRLILFSNTNCIHAPYCIKTYSNFSLFDGAVFSHEIGAIKPEDLFYQTAIETYKLDPENTFYIDDLPANINAGNNFSFKSFQYDFHKQQNFLEEFQAALAAH